MSAQTEWLMEQIGIVEKTIKERELIGDQTSLNHLKEALRGLQRQLTASNEALVEGRQLLKS